MKTIELQTSQNVIIRYELAGLWTRVGAFIIDSIILLLTVLILVWLYNLSFPRNQSELFYYIVIIPIVLFYNLFSEIVMKGQTVGKKAFKIRRVDMRGNVPEISDLILQWTFRSIELYGCLGAIAAVLVSSSDKAQRFGDKLSNTVVVKNFSSSNVTLQDLMKISDIQQNEVKYPGVLVFNEDQMLFMKNVLERLRKNPNQAHKDLFNDLYDEAIGLLGLDEKPKNKENFIKELIHSYVILTR